MTGNSLSCPPQRDSHSCGVLAFNTFRHYTTDAPLWTTFSPGDVALDRIYLFNAISENTYVPGKVLKGTSEGTSNNVVPPVIAVNAHKLASKDVKDKPVDMVIVHDVEQASRKVISIEIEQKKELLREERQMPWWWKKRSCDSEAESSGSKGSDGNNSSEKRKVGIPAGQEKSKSAIFAQKRMKAYQEGTLEVSVKALEDWCSRLRLDDPYVEFDSEDIYRVQHSACGTRFHVKGLLDQSRWREHLKKCTTDKQRKKKATGTQTLQAMGFFNVKTNQLPVLMVPCEGFSEKDDKRIGAMLLHRAASSGGGRDPREIAREVYTINLWEI